MSTTPPALDMGSILTDTSNRVVVCCGAGGVGKTTTAAAMALRAACFCRCASPSPNSSMKGVTYEFAAITSRA